ncbi:MAG: flagellar biosynthesis anti-sigma factor FlgM [Terriglobales bacterium]
MRVDLTTHGTEPADKGKTDRTRPAPPSEQHASETAAPDQTRFSFDQARVRALEGQVLAQPEVRQQRVELLRQALGKGEYAVSDGQVADAMLADLAAGSAGQLAG